MADMFVAGKESGKEKRLTLTAAQSTSLFSDAIQKVHFVIYMLWVG